LADEKDRLSAVAAWYAAAGFEGRMVRESARRLATRCRGSSALEIGCGEGFVTLELSRRLERVIVVEGAEEYAQRLRERHLLNVEVVHGLIEDFDTEATFDTVVVSHVLEHVADPIALLIACVRHLNPRGVVLIAVPNAGSLHRRVGVRLELLSELQDLSEADVQIGHRRVYDEARLRHDIHAAGLGIDALQGHFLKPLSNQQMDQLSSGLQGAFVGLGDELPTSIATELFAECVPAVRASGST
jgi:2-polyprenyl-3-methyl-5-hydroxy-6-metoxy-1,4-benzoquinol methylase